MENHLFYVSGYKELTWLNSGGTRNKKILSDEYGAVYYFKESFNNANGKFYKYEFYSEIVASFIGKMLELDVLEYSIAIYKHQIGCLSKSMNDDQEELIEGGKYLKAFDNSFIVESENPKQKYTFQLIVNALKCFELESHVDRLIDIIIFDSIIGNSDRHQENWGFIAKNTIVGQAYTEIERTLEGKPSRHSPLIKKMLSMFGMNIKIVPNDIIHYRLKNITRDVKFAPIYDSGSSLGRELDESKILSMLKNDMQINAYINKGMAEIHWDGKKYNHFGLLEELIKQDSKVKDRISELVRKIDTTRIQEFVSKIDMMIPEEFESWKIPNYRKDLIVKLITLRSQRLLEIINE